VPTLRARSFPSRIQRLMVSGFRPARRAASGTVSIVVYYNIRSAKSTWAELPRADRTVRT
jgi:hypothetical protein